MKAIDQRRAAATKTTHLACTPSSHCAVYWKQAVLKQLHEALCSNTHSNFQLSVCPSALLKGKQRTECMCARCYIGTSRNPSDLLYACRSRSFESEAALTCGNAFLSTLLEKGKKIENTA